VCVCVCVRVWGGAHVGLSLSPSSPVRSGFTICTMLQEQKNLYSLI